MCAIAGIIDLAYDANLLDNMIATMKHRGPDGAGQKCTDRCCLLHTRLAVIDLDNGRQPMDLEWAGETFTIVYNGELYNTQEIRHTLLSFGHTFLTQSDTEVILHAYAQWRDACLDKLNGIFAFAVWEHRSKRLFLARDRMGVKPLFFQKHNGGLLFASEIKTIFSYPHTVPEITAEGVAQILLLGPGRMPGSGVFRNIYELEPGQCGYYQNGKLSIRQYWTLKDREHTDSFEETAAYIRWLVTDAIHRQTVSDVPVGTFLSGGLDSSLISAICARQFNGSGRVLPTFSVDYHDNDRYFTPEKYQPSSDNTFIKIMQDQINSEHHWTVLSPEELYQSLTAATIARDLPGMSDVDFSLLAFCGNIRKVVKVALSGECADEIFGGYPWYRDPSVLAQNGFPWAQNTRYRAQFMHQDLLAQIDAEDFVDSCYRDTINSCDILSETPETERRMKQMVNLNHRWFMQTLLDRKDRMSMYHGLEVRVPFCDYRIAEYMYGVPWKYKDYNNTEKGLLRYAMKGILPQEVLWRKKSPYPKTHDPKYLQLVKQALEHIISRPDSPILQLVRKDALNELLDTENTWPWYGQLMRRPQTVAYMLQINAWMELYRVRIV